LEMIAHFIHLRLLIYPGAIFTTWGMCEWLLSLWLSLLQYSKQVQYEAICQLNRVYVFTKTLLFQK
jgi:hypothetical protein